MGKIKRASGSQPYSPTAAVEWRWVLIIEPYHFTMRLPSPPVQIIEWSHSGQTAWHRAPLFYSVEFASCHIPRLANFCSIWGTGNVWKNCFVHMRCFIENVVPSFLLQPKVLYHKSGCCWMHCGHSVYLLVPHPYAGGVALLSLIDFRHDKKAQENNLYS